MQAEEQPPGAPPPLPALPADPALPAAPAKANQALNVARLGLAAPILSLVLGFVRAKPAQPGPYDAVIAAQIQGGMLVGGVVFCLVALGWPAARRSRGGSASMPGGDW